MQFSKSTLSRKLINVKNMDQRNQTKILGAYKGLDSSFYGNFNFD